MYVSGKRLRSAKNGRTDRDTFCGQIRVGQTNRYMAAHLGAIGEYDGSIYVASAMWNVDTITVGTRRRC